MTSRVAEIDLAPLIRADQLAGVRQNLSIAIPVNIILSVATFAVTSHHGNGRIGGMWLAASLLVSLLRLLQSRGIWPFRQDDTSQLRWAAALAGLSGIVWACTCLLSVQGTSEAAFHLIVGAGITGGAIAMGFAYSPVAIAFVAPALIANAVSLALAETVEHSFLAATLAIYFAALYRSARQSETHFVGTASLKHEATTLAVSLKEAHAETVTVAEEMTYRARHDSLTGLLNRAGLLQELEDRAQAPADACCLMMLDLDGFKSFNDAFGHKAGDGVLVEVAARIRAVAPGAATARLGGDEFAIAFDLPHLDGSPLSLAGRLIEAIGMPFGTSEAGRISTSIGIYEGPSANAEDLLVFADEALYAAKSAGRNRAHLFDSALKRKRDMRRDSERDLAAAIDSGSIQVWYQPILSEGGRRLSGVEGLLRWNHPNHGWIAPDEVIAAAALVGQSERLLGFIVDRACELAGHLRAAGYLDVGVATNVSPREMLQLPVDAIVLSRLHAARLPARALEIEITEQTAIDVRAVQGKLTALSDAGIRIGIDDFGVGYSSLAMLRQLRADRVKIDRSFVTGLTGSSESRLLFQAMIGLGRAMNLEVVAEGVETAEDALTLRALGCQFMQGYHLGRPMPADALLATLTSHEERGGAVSAA